MNQDRLEFLLERYSRNQCSQEEIEELDEWFSIRDFGKMDFEDWVDEVGGEEKLTLMLFENFRQKVSHINTVNFKLIARIAALVLLVISIGFLFFLKKKSNFNEPICVKKSIEIKPGTDKATLTLSDGSQIILNKSTSGYIASQNDIEINMDSEHRLSYKINPVRNKKYSDNSLSYNTITTPRGGGYRLTLSDGTDVTLDAESSITFPVYFHGTERKVSVTGQVYFNVVHNKKQPFIVTAKGQVVEDIGTAFNVDAYNDNPFLKITLVEGKVKLRNSASNVSLLPGEQAEVKNGQNAIHTEKVNVDEVIAWRTGYFMFHDESIKSIMKEAGRWYDVDIQYIGNFNNKKFGGTISRYKDITELLDNLKIAAGIDYKIEGRRIILMN